jgi:hypothetical protein
MLLLDGVKAIGRIRDDGNRDIDCITVSQAVIIGISRRISDGKDDDALHY